MDKHNWYFRFLADVDWLQSHHQDIDYAMWNLLLELTQDTGVIFGMEVTERGAGPNFSVDVNSGVAYDTYGRRIINNQTFNIPFIEDANGDPIQVVNPGNEKVVSVYVYYHTTDKEPAIDGFGDTVYQFTEEDVEFKLYQGAEDVIGAANPPPNPGDGGILLAHVTISFGDGTIEDADIDATVKEELKLHGDASVIHNFGDEDIEGDKSFINGYDLIFYSDDGVTETARINGETGHITTIGTVDGVDVSEHAHDGPNAGGTVDHGSLDSIGLNTHDDIDAHIADDTVHFTEGSIEHGNILGLAGDDHPQYTHKDQNETISQVWTFNQNIDLAAGRLVDGVDVGSHIHTGGTNGPAIQHHNLAGLGDDDHTQYAHLTKAGQTFSQVISGQPPSASSNFATKGYVDGLVPSMSHVTYDNVDESIFNLWDFTVGAQLAKLRAWDDDITEADTNDMAWMYICKYGYNGGSTQYRACTFGDGRGSEMFNVGWNQGLGMRLAHTYGTGRLAGAITDLPVTKYELAPNACAGAYAYMYANGSRGEDYNIASSVLSGGDYDITIDRDFDGSNNAIVGAAWTEDGDSDGFYVTFQTNQTGTISMNVRNEWGNEQTDHDFAFAAFGELVL